ncbi:MAG TPA: hypothetical protein VK666_28255 [Chryseolinea sp.]|nr:hypothetical protein [Chryseolinea sp.]
MPSLIPGFEYDIFISYRHKDNKGDRWVTDFVIALKAELEATFKEEISVYFDENAADGILETYHVSKSLEGKLKCLILIPVISQTYCDPQSFAWQHEFCAFNKSVSEDAFGRDIKLSNGNVASRIVPVKIHEIDSTDQNLIKNEIGDVLRSVDFIFRSPGVNRPLKANDLRTENDNRIYYRDQINKVANTVKQIVAAMRSPTKLVQVSSPTSHLSVKGIKTTKKPIIVIGTLLLLSILLIGYYLSTVKKQQYLDKSIAVLPFLDLSQEHDQEYFSDGMMEEILNHLAKIKDLRVISRTSSMQYKGTKIALSEIAAKLGVASILEGSVRKSGERVRISVQLIDAVNESTLWSEDYDRELQDIFAVQSEVSIRVAETLKTKLTQQEKESLSKSYTVNPQAYKYYLKGRFFWDKRTRQSFDSAEVYFKRAIEIDPQYALAYAGVADCYSIDLNDAPELQDVLIAKSYVAKALALDSTLGEAWTTMGIIRSAREYDWEGSKKIFEKAIRLNPNYPPVYLFYGNVFFYTGDLQRGIKENKKALDLDPLSFPINGVLGSHYFQAGEYDHAIAQAMRVKTLFGNRPAFLGLTLLKQKKYAEAIDVFANLPETNIAHGLALSYGYAIAGENTRAKEELAKTLKQEGTRSNFWLAIAYIGLKEYDSALTKLERGYEVREFPIATIKVNPLVDPLRNEPRFKALLKKVNLD